MILVALSCVLHRCPSSTRERKLRSGIRTGTNWTSKVCRMFITSPAWCTWGSVPGRSRRFFSMLLW